MQMYLTHLVSKTTILANLRLVANSVKLNILDRVTERTTTTITNCNMCTNLNHRYFMHKVLCIRSMCPMLIHGVLLGCAA